METLNMQQAWLRYSQYLPRALLVLMALLIVGAAYFFSQWYEANKYNKTYHQAALLNETEINENAQLALQQAYLLRQQKPTPENIKKTIHLLTIAEAAKDADIRAHAKFTVGNLYFDLSAISADVVAGGSHQQAVAQIQLAREAYKTAIRLSPDMYAARFNLELLDRLSPQKRTQAWLAETDGVTLQPFKRNGTSWMKDNRRRGLP